MAQAEAAPAVEEAPAAPSIQVGPNGQMTVSPDLQLPGAVRAPRSPSVEEINRQLERIKKLPPTEMGEALEDIRRRFPNALNQKAPDPAPAPDPNATLDRMNEIAKLPEPEQVKLLARMFFAQLVAADARGLVLLSGFPFQLEDRRLESPDETHKEWLKNLRAKRTDLLAIYDVEVMTPAEMEKKYGKPPARLAQLNLKAPKTYVAVGNLSGHAAVAVVKSHPTHGVWQVVGYHD